MARGGKRTGTPGMSYQNRTDLNGPKLAPVKFTDQTYGEQAAQVAAQQQVPITAAPPIPSFTPLDAPTTRPWEPVTHGLPSGPGAGPEALGLTPATPLAELYAAAQLNPELMPLVLDLWAEQ